jgi:hypothetical protein
MGPIGDGETIGYSTPNGGTGILSVLKRVYQDIDAGELKMGKNGKILLFTDGYATDMKFFGKTRLNHILEKYAKKGISISTVGLGKPDDSLMEQIAKKTGGIYVSVDDADQLAEAMQEAITSRSERNLLDYRNPVSYDFLYVIIRLAAVLVIGLLLAIMKAYICEPVLDTSPVLITSVIGSILGAGFLEFGMNKLALPPILMRMLMCVFLAMATLGEAKTGNYDYSGQYKNY